MQPIKKTSEYKVLKFDKIDWSNQSKNSTALSSS